MGDKWKAYVMVMFFFFFVFAFTISKLFGLFAFWSLFTECLVLLVACNGFGERFGSGVEWQWRWTVIPALSSLLLPSLLCLCPGPSQSQAGLQHWVLPEPVPGRVFPPLRRWGGGAHDEEGREAWQRWEVDVYGRPFHMSHYTTWWKYLLRRNTFLSMSLCPRGAVQKYPKLQFCP